MTWTRLSITVASTSTLQLSSVKSLRHLGAEDILAVGIPFLGLSAFKSEAKDAQDYTLATQSSPTALPQASPGSGTETGVNNPGINVRHSGALFKG